jgi:hypothetical protein
LNSYASADAALLGPCEKYRDEVRGGNFGLENREPLFSWNRSNSLSLSRKMPNLRIGTINRRGVTALEKKITVPSR